MAKTVNLTVRVSPTLKAEAEAAAEYLDTNISRLVRDAFREAIDRAQQRRIRNEHFRDKFAEYGIDDLPEERYKPRPKLNLKDESIANIRQKLALGMISREEAEERIATWENPDRV